MWYVFDFCWIWSLEIVGFLLSQQVSTPINTEISACCTICRNWAISPRFKLTWRIRAWQQRRKWNCYRRWWAWSGLQNIYGKPLNESYFTCREPFLIWNDGIWCDWNGWNVLFGFSDFWRQRRTNLRARCHNSDKRLDRCHLNVLHMVATTLQMFHVRFLLPYALWMTCFFSCLLAECK